jgi:hypothetical protein
MHGDNQDTITLAKNPYFHERSKHINVYYYYIWDLAEKKKFTIEYIPIVEIPADKLTKLLARVAFKRFRG